MSPGGLASTGSRLKPAAARIGRPTRPALFRPCHVSLNHDALHPWPAWTDDRNRSSVPPSLKRPAVFWVLIKHALSVWVAAVRLAFSRSPVRPVFRARGWNGYRFLRRRGPRRPGGSVHGRRQEAPAFHED